jgi:cytoskeletal protein CcmA (bactofilin family)
MGFFGRDTQKPGFSATVPGGVGVDPRTAPSPGSGDLSGRRSVPTMIGPNTKINGELSGDEDVVVDGRVEGKINLKKQLTVGPTGQVHAEVRARNILIAGKVIGNVSAEDKVELVATGSLEGNIRAAKIVIAEGAHFKGSVDMSAAKGSEAEAPAVTPSAPASEPKERDSRPARGDDRSGGQRNR